MCPNTNNLLSDFAAKLQLQHYASSSIKAYKNALAKFFNAFESFELEHITQAQIQDFINSLQDKHNISAVYQRQILASISKFYMLHHNRKLDLSVLYPKRKSKPLPKYLTIPEVKKLIHQCRNLKHLCVIKLLYGCGLRVSEVLTLNIEDIDFHAMYLTVRSSKSIEDRVLTLPKSLLQDLHQYYIAYRPKDYLFEGQEGGKYSSRSIQNFIKKYAQKAHIEKSVTPHMLRHSYAIHQLENGINISCLQVLLGHKSIKTTELYTHIVKVSKYRIKSPLDYW